MKMDWSQHIGKALNITMFENYGVVYGKNNEENPIFYEIVFKTGTLQSFNDDGLILESSRENNKYLIFIPYHSIKCVEIF
jgi:hypothetical protein